MSKIQRYETNVQNHNVVVWINMITLSVDDSIIVDRFGNYVESEQLENAALESFVSLLLPRTMLH